MKIGDNVSHKERNLGIDLLKAWMSFEVVLCHYGFGSDELVYKYFFSYFKSMAVPVFMIISFYLFARFILCKEINIEKLGKRLQRIYTPLVSWAIIYWVVYNLFSVKKLALSDFGWQILAGHSYNCPMWFNVVLALLTILFFFLCKYSRFHIVVIILVSLIAIIFSTSGLNNISMSLRPELCYSIGRIAEMIPYAGFGLILYKCRSDKKKSLLVIFVLLITFTGKFCRGLYCSDIISYHYSSLKLFMCSTILVIIFLYIPLRYLPNIAKKILLFLSCYSMGVYCIHILVGTMLSIIGMTLPPFYFSVFIYLLSLLLCYTISIFPYKLLKNIVM